MAFSVTNIGTNTNTSGATLAIAVPGGGVPSGAVICVGASEASNIASPTAAGTVSDTINTYSLISSAANNANNAAGRGSLIYAWNVSALTSANTITFTKNQSGNDAALSAFYITGAATATNPLDSSATKNATGSSSSPSVTATAPSNANDIFVGLISTPNGTTTFTQDSANGAWATPFVQANVGSNATARVNGGNLVVTGTPAQKYNPALGTSATWSAFICAFSLPAAAATTTPTTLQMMGVG